MLLSTIVTLYWLITIEPFSNFDLLDSDKSVNFHLSESDKQRNFHLLDSDKLTFSSNDRDKYNIKLSKNQKEDIKNYEIKRISRTMC